MLVTIGRCTGCPEELLEDYPPKAQEEVGKQKLLHGETDYSGLTRGLDHQKDIEKKSPKNALWRHCLLYRNGNKAEFSKSVAYIHEEAYVRKLKKNNSHHCWRARYLAKLEARIPPGRSPQHSKTEGVWLSDNPLHC